LEEEDKKTILDNAEFFSLLEIFATQHDEADEMIRQHNRELIEL
jgi:hypothetical protein